MKTIPILLTLEQHLAREHPDHVNTTSLLVWVSNQNKFYKISEIILFPKLDTAMSSNHRITLLKKKIQELRKTYNMIKVELASIDRRRKKLRRREREKNKLAKSATS